MKQCQNAETGIYRSVCWLYPLTLQYVTALAYLKLDSVEHRRMEADEKFVTTFPILIVVSTTFFHLNATLYL